jgi:hypothetical protein
MPKSTNRPRLPDDLVTTLAAAKDRWKSFEDWVSVKLNMKKTKASGGYLSNGDARNDDRMLECKWSDNTGPVILRRSVWEKARNQAFRQLRKPVLAMANPNEGYVVFWIKRDVSTGSKATLTLSDNLESKIGSDIVKVISLDKLSKLSIDGD